MSEPNLVVNNLLCFISSTINSYDKEIITHQCASFYNENEITTAKSTFFSHLKIKPTWRKGENKSKLNIIDILDLMCKTDDDNIPSYVADRYNAFPPIFGYESIANDLKALSVEIAEIKENLKNQQVILSRNSENPELEVIKEEIIEIKKSLANFLHTPPKENICNGSDDSIVSRDFASPSAPPFSQEQFSMNEENFQTTYAAYASRPVVTKPTVNSKNTSAKGKGKRIQGANFSNVAHHKHLSSNAGTSQHIPSVQISKRFQMDEDGFYTKIKRKRIVGTKENDNQQGLKAARRTKVIYIGRLEEKTSVEDVENHISEVINVNVIKCYKLKCSMKNCSSFKVIIKEFELDKFLESSFWPQGTVVREFIFNQDQQEANKNSEFS